MMNTPSNRFNFHAIWEAQKTDKQCKWLAFSAKSTYGSLGWTPNPSQKSHSGFSLIRRFAPDAVCLRQGGCCFQIALSNPCFELWYLLHFVYSTSELPTYKAVEQKLSTPVHIPNYDKREDYFDKLEKNMDTAIKNAKKLKQFHVEQGKSNLFDVTTNPYTNVWELVEFINTSKT